MRKILSKATLIIMAVTMMFSFASCKEDKVEGRVLETPDSALIGTWSIDNPENSDERLVYEFKPDSTVAIRKYVGGVQQGVDIKGLCVYIEIGTEKAIEITLQHTGTKQRYFYMVLDDGILLSDPELGNVITLVK